MRTGHRYAWEARSDKQRELNRSEAAGEVADSLEVRGALLERVRLGEITLEQAQTELKRIKRNAKKNGLITRTQAYRRG